MKTPQSKDSPPTTAKISAKPVAPRAMDDKEAREKYAERAEARHTPGMKHGKKAMQDRTESD